MTNDTCNQERMQYVCVRVAWEVECQLLAQKRTTIRDSPSLWLQLPRLEFLPSRPEVAELVDRRGCRREREHVKRFGNHRLEVILWSDADRDVRIELFAGFLWDECRDVVDGRLVDLRVFWRGDVRGRGPGFLREWGNGVDQFLLQPQRVVSRLDHDAPKADVLPWKEVVLESVQLPAGDVLVGENLACCGVDFVEVGRADVPLQHRDVRMVCGIQTEALGKDLEQTSVGSLGVLDHRCVRLERNVDGRDFVLLRAGRLDAGEQRSDAGHKCGEDVHVSEHWAPPIQAPPN